MSKVLVSINESLGTDAIIITFSMLITHTLPPMANVWMVDISRVERLTELACVEIDTHCIHITV